jgi:hypothetical protein
VLLRTSEVSSFWFRADSGAAPFILFYLLFSRLMHSFFHLYSVIQLIIKGNAFGGSTGCGPFLALMSESKSGA